MNSSDLSALPLPAPELIAQFAPRLLAWHARWGRHHLPWQTRDPYRVWLAEIMLQQTQVATVLPYYQRFLDRFPTVETLATAPLTEVLAHWSGLGYYVRARQLHRAAQQIVATGTWPQTAQQWQRLPGIGRSTANAIAAFTANERRPILDGNVARLLIRLLALSRPLNTPSLRAHLWRIAEQLLPVDSTVMPRYTQAQMDLGALICRRVLPQCDRCPLTDLCRAHALRLTAQLPIPAPRSPLETLHLSFAAYRFGERYYFTRRPERGLWPGLYSFPQTADPPPPGRWHPLLTETLPPHRLTHRQLHLTLTTFSPLHLPDLPTPHVPSPSAAWLTLPEALAAGLPRPLTRWAQRTLAQSPLLPLP
ncbi:MAG: A/G-specific adenine glycosylase [Hydrogenophilus sp.]|nr:A/G-specific adenine glycosylase [Hydrogenophilus sp.]